jgi:hypothetical protein
MVSCFFINGIFTFVFISLSYPGLNYFTKVNKPIKLIFTLNWSEYSDFLTFRGGLNPVIGGLWLTDTAHHHLAIAVLSFTIQLNEANNVMDLCTPLILTK